MRDSAEQPQETKASKAVFFAAFVSLLFHVCLLLVGPKFFTPKANSSRTPKSVKVVFRDRALHADHQNDDESPKSVVSLTPENIERPEEANYFSEHDQKASKELVAKLRRESEEASAKPEVKGTNDPSEATKIVLQEEKPQDTAKEHLKDTASKVLTANDFLKKPKDKSFRDPLGLRVPPGNSDKDAMPLAEHLPNVEEGEKTQLNAWQWRHATFFNRIKSSIARTWSPNSQIERFDPKGALLGQLDRVTVMQVTIDTFGKLKALSVANSSGVSYLDEEAERSFREAAPFPFPPRELFKSQDEFTFKFAFHLQVNRGIKLDFDWDSGG